MNRQWDQNRVSKNRRFSERAFTLVEVAVAVAIAGIGLATLVVLQTRIINTYAFERNLTKAVLYAQYVMTFVEIEAKKAEYGTQQGDLASVLDESGYFQTDDESSKNERATLEGWEYFKEIEKEDFGLGEMLASLLPGAGKDFEIARKVRLTISWGPGQSQQYTLVYFTRKQQKEV